MEKGRKLNFMKTKDNIFMHRQIEKRGNLVFMRLKVRPMIVIRHMTHMAGAVGQ